MIDPQSNFLTFMCNVMLIVCTILTIFNTRNMAEEYFIRKNLKSVFEQK